MTNMKYKNYSAPPKIAIYKIFTNNLYLQNIYTLFHSPCCWSPYPYDSGTCLHESNKLTKEKFILHIYKLCTGVSISFQNKINKVS